MPDKRYAAVFGRNQALSVAELSAVGATPKPLTDDAVLVKEALFDVLGGTIKIVELFGAASAPEKLIDELVDQRKSAGKLRFGISCYGSANIGSLLTHAKRKLKERSISAGFVQSKEPLNLAQVKHNHLLDKGVEWCLFETPNGWVGGRTVWIPDFEGFARRDFEKPASDAKRGMLPPQLARTMVNLGTQGKTKKTVYDPFCGVGNLLLESVELGHKTFGSDISDAAIAAAQKNLEWLGKPGWELAVIDATQKLPTDSCDALVTEGYLGQPVQQTTADPAIRKEAEEVSELLLKFFEQAKKKLQPGSRLVITWPIWKLSEDRLRLELIDQVKGLGYTVIRPVPEGFSTPELSDRDSIEVARPNQRVIHELFIFERT